MRRRSPRPLTHALDRLATSVAPLTPLARIQAAWAEAVGPVIAQNAEPLRERGGVLTVLCQQSVWAQEVALMGVELTARLNAVVGEELVREIRTTATPR
jgi:predicted nucleic acid-binding Zn ribbon protein